MGTGVNFALYFVRVPSIVPEKYACGNIKTHIFFKSKEEIQESPINFFVWVISGIENYRTKGLNLVLCSGLLHKLT